MLSLNNSNNLYRRGSALHLVRFAWLPKLFGTGSGCPQSASSVWFALFLAMPFRPSFSSSPVHVFKLCCYSSTSKVLILTT